MRESIKVMHIPTVGNISIVCIDGNTGIFPCIWNVDWNELNLIIALCVLSVYSTHDYSHMNKYENVVSNKLIEGQISAAKG